MRTRLIRPRRALLTGGLVAPLLWSGFAPGVPDDRLPTGTVEGRVSFETMPDNEFFEVSDAVIYLSGGGLTTETPAPPRTPERLLLDQIDYTFVPRVMPVMAGDELSFHNSDDELHNIHTYAKGRRRNRNFNRGQRPNSTFTGVFARPDSILVLCDIHSQMIAHILVLDNRFFTKAVDDGAYAITDVPPGQYDLTAWHEWFGEVRSTVEVGDGQTVSMDIHFSGTPLTPGAPMPPGS